MTVDDERATLLRRARFALGGGGAVCGLVVALFARGGALTPPAGLSEAGLVVAGVVVAMAALWVTELLPLAGTALFPLALFPLLGVAPAKEVAPTYLSSIVVLLMGGFFLARALEHWRVPGVIAGAVERWAGGSPVRLLYGLMAVTAGLSMWLSNTATTLVMMTVATAAVARASSSTTNDPRHVRAFALALVLGTAYAANMGGIATPVGTAPNAILLGVLDTRADAVRLSFLAWMIAAVPFVVVMTPLMAVLMHRVLTPFPATLTLAPSETAREPLSRGGRRATAIFVLIAFLWIFRVDIDLVALRVPGWASALGLASLVDEGAIAVIGVILMMATPSGERPGERVLSWATAEQVPWSLLLLFGGGLAIADQFGKTGLSVWLGQQLLWLEGAPVILIVFALALGMSLLTEVTSNTATTTLLLPVVAAVASELGIAPLTLMWPATLCASAAFILPISTPPNAIAAGAANVSVPEMARVGFALNLIAVVLVTALTTWWLPVALRLTGS